MILTPSAIAYKHAYALTAFGTAALAWPTYVARERMPGATLRLFSQHTINSRQSTRAFHLSIEKQTKHRLTSFYKIDSI
jgi:hypothetical protein